MSGDPHGVASLPAAHERVTTAVHDWVDGGGGFPVDFDDVAARAGMSADELRRMWPTAASLVIDVLGEGTLDPSYDVVVTGDLRHDLTYVAALLARFLGTPRGLFFLRTVVAAAADPDDPMTPDHPLVRRRLGEYQQILDAANEREIGVRDVLDGLLAPLLLEALTSTRFQPDQTEISRQVDVLLRISSTRSGSDQERRTSDG